MRHVPYFQPRKLREIARTEMEAIRKGGLAVLAKKAWLLFLALVCLPLIVLVRVLSPVLLIRFGWLYSERIGHYAMNTELYLCERDAGLQPKDSLDLFFNNEIVCNNQLKKMWDRVLHVTPLVKHLYHANHLVPGYRRHKVSLPTDRDMNSFFDSMPMHLSLTRDEEERGYEDLPKIGLPPHAKFICFHSRDSGYLRMLFRAEDADTSNRFRNSDVNTFVPALEELSRRGYYAVRMGARESNPLRTDNPMIIDYCKKYKTEFLDIFLFLKCHFYLGDSCGLSSLADTFRRPTAVTNLLPLEYANSWGDNNLFIPKKLWLPKERRVMTFREILGSEVGRFQQTEPYLRMGIEMIENTPEEIAAVAIELEERLKGTWVPREEDEELQRRFWDLFKGSPLHGVIKARIGADFLRANRELLG